MHINDVAIDAPNSLKSKLNFGQMVCEMVAINSSVYGTPEFMVKTVVFH